MAQRDVIVGFCERLLNTREITEPWCENGLQVEGKLEVRKIAVGVTASAGFLDQAAKWGADMAIVHHGLFLKKGVSRVRGVLKNRLKILLTHDISLAGFHIPLDAHPEIGNNAALMDMLGLENRKPVDCGFIAEFGEEKEFDEVVRLVEEKIGKVNFCEHFSAGPIQKIGVISGGAGSFGPLVAGRGADAFLFGEMRESDYHVLKELGLSFIAAGHFATERYGVQRLGERIGEQFGDVEVQFFDEDCPV